MDFINGNSLVKLTFRWDTVKSLLALTLLSVVMIGMVGHAEAEIIELKTDKPSYDDNDFNVVISGKIAERMIERETDVGVQIFSPFFEQALGSSIMSEINSDNMFSVNFPISSLAKIKELHRGKIATYTVVVSDKFERTSKSVTFDFFNDVPRTMFMQKLDETNRAYDGRISITNLMFYSFDRGDYFILEGTFGPDILMVEPVMITIIEKNRGNLVHSSGIKINDRGGYVQEDTGGRVWSFSGFAKFSPSQTVEIGNTVPDRLKPDIQYTIKVQYGDKHDEIDFELATTDEGQIIIPDNTVKGFQIMETPTHFPDDSDITRYMQMGNEPILSYFIYNQEDNRASTAVKYLFENIDGDNNLESGIQKGTAPPHGFFHSYASYFVENIGRFYIHIIHDVDEKMTENPNSYEFIIVKEHSDAAINGCSDGRQIIVKPGYAKTVCVLPDSFEKLVQRGWISD